MGTLKQLGLTGGETLLVLGAAGSVGMIATQLAVSRGATVVGAAASRDHNLVRDLGAVPVSYGPGLADRVRQIVPSVHAVLDAAGKGGLPDAIDLAGGPKRVTTLSGPEALPVDRNAPWRVLKRVLIRWRPNYAFATALPAG